MRSSYVISIGVNRAKNKLRMGKGQQLAISICHVTSGNGPSVHDKRDEDESNSLTASIKTTGIMLKCKRRRKTYV